MNLFDPSCDDCCEDPCEFESDDFSSSSLGSWTTVAGSWSVVSQKLQTTSSNGVIVNTMGEPSGNTEQVVDGTFESDTDGDEIRVIIAYADSSNYLYVQFTIGDCGSIEFYKVVGGTHTQLGQTLQKPIDKSTAHAFKVCYLDGTYPINDRIELFFDGTFYGEDVTATGDQAGLGTGTVTGTVDFDDWRQRTYNDGDGCPTCGPDPVICDIFDDDFDRADGTDIGCNWKEVSGDWEIASNLLKIEDSSAIARVERPHPFGTNHSTVEVSFRGDTVDDTIRIILDYDPATGDFHYAEATLSNDLVPTGGLAIWEFIGGVATQLGESIDVALNTDTWHTMRFCVGNGVSDVQVNGSNEFTFGVALENEVNGKYVGLGTGLGIAGTVEFDNINWDRTYDSSVDPLCDTCEVAGPKCIHCGPFTGPGGDDMPTEFMAVVAGTFSSNDPTDCPVATETCQDLAGTYVLNQQRGIAADPCKRTVTTAHDPCAGAVCGTAAIVMQVGYSTTLSKYFINVTVGQTGGTIQYEKLYTSKPECKNLDGEVIPFKATTGTCCKANAGSTVTLTAM